MNATGTKEMREWFERHREVMLAHEQGKDVQVLNGNGLWKSTNRDPGWLMCNQYRVTPPPPIRPYNRKELDALVGEVLVSIETGARTVVTCGPGLVMHDERHTIVMRNTHFNWDEVLEKFRHVDGTRCGVELPPDLY